MKRTALKRRAFIKRKGALVFKRKKPRRVAADRVRDPVYLATVRTLPCVSRNLPGACCWGDVEASHRDEGKGMGLKTSDLECIPQCHACHLGWTNHCGPFEGWDRERRRLWFATATLITQQTLERRRLYGVPVAW